MRDPAQTVGGHFRNARELASSSHETSSFEHQKNSIAGCGAAAGDLIPRARSARPLTRSCAAKIAGDSGSARY
jgi:hypothetical protein